MGFNIINVGFIENCLDDWGGFDDEILDTSLVFKDTITNDYIIDLNGMSISWGDFKSLQKFIQRYFDKLSYPIDVSPLIDDDNGVYKISISMSTSAYDDLRGLGFMEESKKIVESVETKVPEFSAYITNLGKYNEGSLVGEWVKFPIDEDDFDAVLARIGVSNEPDETGTYYEEWFVTDYECNLNGFDWQEFGEYPSYETLQEFGELIESIDDVTSVDNAYEVTGDLQKAIDGLENGDIIFYEGINNESDLGYEILDDIYGNDIPEDLLERYFDFDMFGRDLSFDEYEGDDGEYVSAGEYWCGDENASDYDIGVACVEQLGGTEGISNPGNYFDYEAFGRDLTFDGFTFTSDGCIEYR